MSSIAKHTVLTTTVQALVSGIEVKQVDDENDHIQTKYRSDVTETKGRRKGTRVKALPSHMLRSRKYASITTLLYAAVYEDCLVDLLL